MSEPLTVMEDLSTGHRKHVNIDSLPDEVLAAIFKNIPVSERLEHVELVCKRFFTLCRREDVWTRVSLVDDLRWRDQVDFNLLLRIVRFSTGARATLHGTVLRPCPIQELDLGNTSCTHHEWDLVKFVVEQMPQLRALYAHNMGSSGLGPLYWHAQGIQSASMLLERHKSNAVLHVDVKLVEEDMRYQSQPSIMDQVHMLMQELERTPPRIIAHGLYVRVSRAEADAASAGAVLRRVLQHQDTQKHLTKLSMDIPGIAVTKALLTDMLTNSTTALTNLELRAPTITHDAVLALFQFIENGTTPLPSRLVMYFPDLSAPVRQLLLRQLAVWLTKTKDCAAFSYVQLTLNFGIISDDELKLLNHLYATVRECRATRRAPHALLRMSFPRGEHNRAVLNELARHFDLKWWDGALGDVVLLC